MKLLVGKTHDPAARATFALSSRPMTALDTTNLRLTFTAPETGRVTVRIVAPYWANNRTPQPRLLLGVLEGTTARARSIAAYSNWYTSNSGFDPFSLGAAEAFFTVTGLTPGQSYTWDAAAGVPTGGNSYILLGWGGPNDATASNALGGFQFQIWDPGATLLAAQLYDPPVVTKVSISARKMAALDPNLQLTFTAPASGRVMVRVRSAVIENYGGPPAVYFGVIDGTTVRARVLASGGGNWYTDTVYSGNPLDAAFPVLNLAPSAQYTWRVAWGVEKDKFGAQLAWGGADTYDNPGQYVTGGFLYEIWEA